MKLTNSKEIENFKNAISRCKGDVWLASPEGDKFNLKSVISQYIALGELLKEHGNDLELFCQLREDEVLFYRFFKENPGVND